VPLRPTDTGAKVGELHVQLLALGAVIASDEQTGKNFGPSTGAAVRAFRQRYGLPPGDTVDLPTARLMHVASTFASGGRAPLAAAVREASAADTSQPQVLYWLARYATLAGDYQTAHTIAGRIPDHPDVKAVIDPILALPDQAQPTPGQPPLAPPPRPPEAPYPENFYTYRYKLLPQEDLDELLVLAASALSGSSARMMIRPLVGRDGEGEWPGLPDEPEPEPEPPPGTRPDPDRQKALLESADSWLKAVDHWQFGNEEFNKRHYASAVSAYTSGQKYALNYFAKFYAAVDFGDRNLQLSLEQRVNSYVVTLINNETRWSSMWEAIRQRRLMLTLQELGTHDWSAVTKNENAVKLLKRNLGGEEDSNAQSITALRQRSLDRPLLILATIMAPLARAEANRLRRQYDAAGRDLSRVLRPYQVRVGGTPPTVRDVWLTCDFIELPFARLLLAETLLDQADAEYKARTRATGRRAPDVTQFQGLKAAQTYLAIKEVFQDEGEYVSHVETAATRLTETIRQRLEAKDTSSQEFQLLGKNILVPTLVSASPTLPGLDRRAKAHEPMLKLAGQTVMPETNPRVYAALLTATAHLEQLKAGFNYLGYLDTYVPPWRFQFLLERARYFAEHAKNAQRDYLNFLSNAEREEFQELSASQNVEMEKSNVRIETARVDQVQLEMGAAFQSATLASIAADNAENRLENYKDFDEKADDASIFAGIGIGVSALGGIAAGAIAGTAIGGPIGGLAGGIVGGFTSALSGGGQAVAQIAQLYIANSSVLSR